MNSHQDLLVKEGLRLLTRLNTPISLSAAIKLRYGDIKGLYSITVDPMHYNDPEKLAKDLQAVNFFKKMTFLESGIDTKQQAYKAWLAAEEQCANTNSRFDTIPGLTSHLKRAKEIIAFVLPPLNTARVDEIMAGARIGPGACVGGRGILSMPHRKMGINFTLTLDLIHFVRFLGDHALIRAHRDESRTFEVVKGNQLVFVPKDGRTDRPIAIEPFLNMYIQLGIGAYIKKRLKRVGICLESGQEYHKELVRRASKEGHLSTIDLSSASDTISKQLVRDLLPPDWFLLLDSCRSKYTQLPDGTWHENAKFSSMGNGFTFELETLIFYALAKSQADFVSVYGDDIICDNPSFSAVRDVLTDMGFTLNQGKSFHNGLFKESCGADYFDGTDVRPVYIKEAHDTIDHRIAIINAIYLKRDTVSWKWLRPLWLNLIKKVPAEYRLFGPIHTNAIHNSSEYWITKWKDQTKYVYVPDLQFKRCKPVAKPMTTLAYALYGLPSRGYAPRGARITLRRRWVPIWGISVNDSLSLEAKAEEWLGLRN